MAVVVFQNQWQKPPLGSRSSRAHPLSSLYACAFNEGAGRPFMLGPNDFKAMTITGSPSWSATQIGGSYKFNATSDYIEFPANNTIPGFPTNACTILMIRRKTDTTLRASVAFGVQATAGTPLVDASVPYSDGVIYWDFGGNASPNRLTWGGYSVSTLIEYWAFTGGPAGSAIYFNGIKRSSQGTAISRTADGSTFRINSALAGFPGDLQEFLFFAIDDRQWTDAMVAAWFVNSYGAWWTPRKNFSAPAALSEIEFMASRQIFALP